MLAIQTQNLSKTFGRGTQTVQEDHYHPSADEPDSPHRRPGKHLWA
jgi:hypothetical protein